MGRESRKKQRQRQTRAAEAQKLRVVVCGYPSSTLADSADLLKAAVLYADEVVLHHPTATILASLVAVTQLPNDEFVDWITSISSSMGTAGASLTAAMEKIWRDHGDDAPRIMRQLLQPGSDMHRRLEIADPVAALSLAQFADGFAQQRSDLDEAVEQQLEAAGVHTLIPAIDADILRLAPVADGEDLMQSYLAALWEVLRDRHYHPLLDPKIADLVMSSIREGIFEPTPQGRSRATQAGAASQFLAALPTFPLAGMDEILDIRKELSRPLTRFRSEMARVSRVLDADAYEPGFPEAASAAWTEVVAPALDELDSMVADLRLSEQFKAHLTPSGLAATGGALIAGVMTGEPMTSAGVAIAAAAAAAVGMTASARSRLEAEIRGRPYYLLHRSEQLLSGPER